MPIGNPTTLKEKVDALEQTLLAISNVSEIASHHISSGKDPLESCAYLLEHLIEPAMYQVEALRVMIEAIPEAA
jgi:hypothetical protein